MKTNKIANEFSHNVTNIEIFKEKNNGKRFVFAKNNKKRIYLEKISFWELFKEKYSLLGLGIGGIALVELFAYGYLPFIIFAIALEFFMHKKKDVECFQNIKRFYSFFRYFIFMEIIVYIVFLFIDMKNILLSAPIASSLFLVNFYVFTRIYIFMLQIKFRTLYRMKDHDGFYIWSEAC